MTKYRTLSLLPTIPGGSSPQGACDDFHCLLRAQKSLKPTLNLIFVPPRSSPSMVLQDHPWLFICLEEVSGKRRNVEGRYIIRELKSSFLHFLKEIPQAEDADAPAGADAANDDDEDNDDDDDDDDDDEE
jgi:hypothetical protein